MEWAHLLSTTRLGKSTNAGSATPGNIRSEFNKDYGRVLYSSAFRRLQDKTQVFPLGRNDYVRTRMTHSLEVANVGRTLAQKLHTVICDHGEEALPDLEAMVDIVATVCLAHDIGNPPFGHSGEDAITAALKGTRFEGYRFEGNAQGFRLLSRICDPIHDRGLDLTAATLAAFAKYPCTVIDKQGHYKKHGIAEEEAPLFSQVAQLCRLRSLAPTGHVWARHPLALLMEAADDISYLIADVEDAFFSKIISYDRCVHMLAAMSHNFDTNRPASTPHEQASRVHLARALAVSACIERVADVLSTHYHSIMQGSFEGSLMSHTSCYLDYEQVKKDSVTYIYNHESVTRIEIAGYAVLGGLLDIYMQWVTSPDSALGRKIGAILHPPADTADEHARFLHIIDYLSGMTDSFALHTYTTLTGRSGLTV